MATEPGLRSWHRVQSANEDSYTAQTAKQNTVVRRFCPLASLLIGHRALAVMLPFAPRQEPKSPARNCLQSDRLGSTWFDSHDWTGRRTASHFLEARFAKCRSNARPGKYVGHWILPRLDRVALDDFRPGLRSVSDGGIQQ